jgi:hypothetical protein
MTRGLRHWEGLLKLREDLGPIYGSEDLCVLLYSLARRDKPRSIVEIGTGLGVCTCWIANALRENGFGRILSTDDGRDFDSIRSVRAAARDLMAHLDGRQGRREELTSTVAIFVALQVASVCQRTLPFCQSQSRIPRTF